MTTDIIHLLPNTNPHHTLQAIHPHIQTVPSIDYEPHDDIVENETNLLYKATANLRIQVPQPLHIETPKDESGDES